MIKHCTLFYTILMLLWDNVRDTYYNQYIFVNIIIAIGGTIKHIDGLKTFHIYCTDHNWPTISLNINYASY